MLLLIQPTPCAAWILFQRLFGGGEALAETGAHWQAMRLSRNRNWGHPDTIDYIKTIAKQVAELDGWAGLYIGDISQPRGGPMTSGHQSHQLGPGRGYLALSAKSAGFNAGRTRGSVGGIGAQ